MNIVIDRDTGLPALPEGYWWEVAEDKSDSWGVDYLVVGIMHDVEILSYWRRKPTGKFTPTYYQKQVIEWSKFSQSSDPKTLIRELATEVYKKASYRWLAESRKEFLEGLMGTYPPKSLNEEKS